MCSLLFCAFLSPAPHLRPKCIHCCLRPLVKEASDLWFGSFHVLLLPKTKHAYLTVLLRNKKAETPSISLCIPRKTCELLFCYQGLLTEPEMREEETLKATHLVWSLDFWPQYSLPSPDRETASSQTKAGLSVLTTLAVLLRRWARAEQEKHGDERAVKNTATYSAARPLCPTKGKA